MGHQGDDVTTVTAMHPGKTDIEEGKKVIIAQDNEENWVIIWVEC